MRHSSIESVVFQTSHRQSQRSASKGTPTTLLVQDKKEGVLLHKHIFMGALLPAQSRRVYL